MVPDVLIEGAIPGVATVPAPYYGMRVVASNSMSITQILAADASRWLAARPRDL